MRRIFPWVFAGVVFLFGCSTKQGSESTGLSQRDGLVAELQARGYQFEHELSGGASAVAQAYAQKAPGGQHSVHGLSMDEPGIKTELKANSTANSKFGSFTDAELITRLRSVESMFYTKRVFGDDDRFDLCQEINWPGPPDPAWACAKQYANSVAALFRASDVLDNGDGTFTLRTETFKNRYHLCDGERFENQPVGAFATAFLVGSNLIVTAGHCIAGDNAPKVGDIRVVFGYRMLNDTTAVTNILAADVYTLDGNVPNTHFKYIKDVPGADWAVLSLSRVCRYKPLPLRRQGTININDKLFTMGHPSGLPLKIARNAQLTSDPHPASFSASLDVFAGNSGGPVFNSNGIVEGIVSMGGRDFIFKMGTNCRISMVVPDKGTNGFVCTATAAFSQLVP
jgi:S1-C subfamily serine protease